MPRMRASLPVETFPICAKVIDSDDVILIREKGAEVINNASKERGDNILVTPGNKVHSSCRKSYTNRKSVVNAVKQVSHTDASAIKRSARVSSGPSNSRTHCLFCGTLVATLTDTHLSINQSSCVKTDTIVSTLLDCCDSRQDEWSVTVKGRIEYYMHELHAADCLYHHACSINFRTGRDIPLMYQTDYSVKRRKFGRPSNVDQEQAFQETCEYLEANDDEQLTMSALSDKMREFLQGSDCEPYGNQYLKQKLEQRYGDSICICSEGGVRDIVTMKEKTDQILRPYFKTAKDGDDESKKTAIIETAIRLIKSDIKSDITSVRDQYPGADDLKLDSSLNYLPSSLLLALDKLCIGKDKRRQMASLGQALIQASRPRSVLPPLQLGLACQLHYLFRSRFLVDTLHAMGFCSSYSEVQRFEKNAACSTAPDVLGGDINPSNTTVLFAADNVDHNTITIDGKGTFHGMGMIGAITPKRQTTDIVPRRNVSDINITEISKIEIEDYCAAEKVRSHINFQLLPERQASDANRVDILWEMSFHFRQPMPSWQGMMHIVHQGSDHPGQSSVIFLPMIDMYPGDKTCIYSTLHYLTKLASEHNINPVVTFDQPLFWKASEIINDAPESSCLKNVVLLLGSFHTFMNLLGAIGTLMGGSGLKNVLETAYGENAVGHMLTGKSVQRAFRGHLLVDKCLNREIANEVQKVDPTFALLVDELEKLHASLLSGETNLDALLNSDCLIKLEQMMDTKGSELSDRSKTSKLWLKYMWMLDIAKELIRADRTGSWQMHLHAVTECLPIFSAAGHSNYLKSAYLYLQNMHDLKTKSPRVYQKFENGFHVIRRSNQFWAGLGSDLVIEQTLMRSLKSTGGLTRGSGITEQQRAIWTLSSPVSAEYNSEMQTFTNLSYTTSEQHKEVATSRMNRDASDAAKIAEKLDGCSPFSPDESLRNIITGAVANDDVTVHELDTIGRRTVAKMVGHSVFSYSVKRSSRVKTMASVTAVKIDEEKSIDAALLFQRFLVVSHTADLSLEDVMSYELCPFPPSLFESKDLLRKADKPQIAEAIRTHVGSESNDAITEAIPATEHYVLDGGSLLHRLKWTDGSSYSSIAEDYANFTVYHYGKPTVIFDGYDGGPSIKDNTHLRRTRNQQQPTVNITETTQFAGKKEEILSNNKNKQTIINLISERLQQKGCDVKHSEGDADVDIVRTASALSKTMSTTVIGEDTDLLILLLHQASVSECKELYFRSDIQSRSRKIVYNIKQLKHKLGVDICTQLLFIYAFTGCDSTSRIFGIGKKSAFQKLIKGHSVLKECAKIFTTPGNDKTVIDKSGSNAMVTLFNGKQTVSLASIRYSMLSRKVATAKTFVTPERLPPTESASNLHSRRTYLQVMVWMGTSVTMHPVDWGWSLQEDKTRLIPVMMKKKAAPENLLKVVRCSCTCGCGTLRCSCKKYGLMCSAACGQCQVNICENMPT